MKVSGTPMTTLRITIAAAALALLATNSYAQTPTAPPDNPATSQQTPQDVNHTADAYYNFAMGHAAEAIAEAEQAIKADPDNPGPHRLLARIYVRNLSEVNAGSAQRDTIDKAIEQFKEILRLDPRDGQSALWLARLYRFENEHDKAEETLRTILNRDPQNEGALEQMSQLLMDEGRTPEAIELLTKAAALTTSPTLFDLLGDAYSQSHEYAKAEEAYRKAVEGDPDDVSHRKELAQTLLTQEKFYDAQGRYADAAHVLADAIAGVRAANDSNGNPSALAILYEEMGRIYREKKDFNSAEKSYEELGKLGPESAKRAQMLLIDTYRESHEIDRALAEAQKAIKDSPKDRALVVTYAILLGEKGQLDEAAKVLRGLLVGNEDDEDIYLDLAQVQERGRRYADAEQSALKAQELANEPAEKETAAFMLGAIYERQKKYDLAEAQFKKALDLDPKNAAALNYYGYMLADRGIRLEEATSLIGKALEQEPGNGAYLDSLGWAYYKQDKLAEAEEFLKKAVDRTGEDPTILGHLGDVYAKMGRMQRAEALWEKALAEWQKALPADYEADKVSELDQRLKDLKKRVAQKPAPDNTSQPQ